MKLYHYSKERYDDIRSKIGQGVASPTKDIRGYNNSISLFIEPMPRNIALLWNGQHTFYKSGDTWFEYQIDTNRIPIDVEFTLTESIQKTNLLYNVQNWEEGQPEEVYVKMKQEIRDLEAKLGLNGRGRLNMVKAIKSQPKDIEKHIREVVKLHAKHPDDKLNDRYLACVPHLMIYVGMTPIKYNEVREFELD